MDMRNHHARSGSVHSQVKLAFSAASPLRTGRDNADIC
jgi:hypothetical protein